MTALPSAMPGIARRVARTLRRMGCTCPEPDVRWDAGDGTRGDGMPVALHYGTCPLTPRRRDEDEDGGES